MLSFFYFRTMITIPIKKIEIPPKGIHLLVTVIINTVKTLFVLDTGASRSVIDLNHLRQLKEDVVLSEEMDQSAGVGASDLQGFTANIGLFEIGELKIENFEIAAMNLSHVIESYEKLGNEPIYGVLGGEILDDFNGVIDYKKSTLVFHSFNAE